MRRVNSLFLLGAGSLLLGACAVAPVGPTVRVYPPPGKPWEVFAGDDQVCRGYAQQSTANVQESANAAAVGSAVVGTAIGATAGALMGGHNGAAAGAGVGLVMGSAVGAGESNRASWSMQRRYDYAYEQCMYSRGNLLPSQAYYYRYGYPPAAYPPPAYGPAPAYPPPPNTAPPPAAAPTPPAPPPPPPPPAS